VATGNARSYAQGCHYHAFHQWVCDDWLVAYFTIIATHRRIGERGHQGDRS
jgi:hypothetical protein